MWKMNKLFSIVTILVLIACSPIDLTTKNGSELAARDGVPGRRVGGGTR